MVRIALFVILSVFLARAFWRLVDGMIEGFTGQPRAGNVSRIRAGVQMARDPLCGTYVVPARAVSITVGRRQLFFCSTACRDAYRARPSKGSGSGRPGPAEGRTA